MVLGTIRIDDRFQGPPGSGNGGYVAGRLAAYVEGAAIVRLHAPPPLDVDLEVHRDQDQVRLVHEDLEVARARVTSIDLDVPAAPSLAEAHHASRRFTGFDDHPFPSCFVCGIDREEGDGLRVFAGPVVTRAGVVACVWRPDASLADAGGGDGVAPEFVWAALDCPGAFALGSQGDGPYLLGELAVDLRRQVCIGEEYVLIGWLISRDGRKHVTGTAAFDRAGELVGVGRGTWIRVAPSAAAPAR